MEVRMKRLRCLQLLLLLLLQWQRLLTVAALMVMRMVRTRPSIASPSHWMWGWPQLSQSLLLLQPPIPACLHHRSRLCSLWHQLSLIATCRPPHLRPIPPSIHWCHCHHHHLIFMLHCSSSSSWCCQHPQRLHHASFLRHRDVETMTVSLHHQLSVSVYGHCS